MKADKRPHLAKISSPFVVVPPQATTTKPDVTQSALAKTDTKTDTKMRAAIAESPEKDSQKSSEMLGRKGLVLGAIALGVGLVMLLPIPNYVTGEVEARGRCSGRN